MLYKKRHSRGWWIEIGQQLPFKTGCEWVERQQQKKRCVFSPIRRNCFSLSWREKRRIRTWLLCYHVTERRKGRLSLWKNDGPSTQEEEDEQMRGLWSSQLNRKIVSLATCYEKSINYTQTILSIFFSSFYFSISHYLSVWNSWDFFYIRKIKI